MYVVYRMFLENNVKPGEGVVLCRYYRSCLILAHLGDFFSLLLLIKYT